MHGTGGGSDCAPARPARQMSDRLYLKVDAPRRPGVQPVGRMARAVGRAGDEYRSHADRTCSGEILRRVFDENALRRRRADARDKPSQHRPRRLRLVASGETHRLDRGDRLDVWRDAERANDARRVVEWSVGDDDAPARKTTQREHEPRIAMHDSLEVGEHVRLAQETMRIGAMVRTMPSSVAP